ncbi:YopX family protein [Bacillus inaquosorum]|uniref:YopX family protein n=1 Tax=Bacillus inaquosorum TaxID=483913 RepID=UPI002282DB21|nr:YopX family protein [Bacillus inaquosorum]MCY8247482.1 YopX family protein [Bacillus inaquosorum]MCY8251564.1 YopX family protein [Bacillus inaquosorum]
MNTAYRVWDGEQMYYWDDEELSLEIKMNEWILWRDFGDGCRVSIAESHEEGTALMWGTGFFDYGVIYQNDIIKGKRESTWHPGYDKVLGKVEFSKDTHGFYIEGMGAGPLYRIEPNFEIIGDAYQNPELLEGAE